MIVRHLEVVQGLGFAALHQPADARAQRGLDGTSLVCAANVDGDGLWRHPCQLWSGQSASGGARGGRDLHHRGPLNRLALLLLVLFVGKPSKLKIGLLRMQVRWRWRNQRGGGTVHEVVVQASSLCLFDGRQGCRGRAGYGDQTHRLAAVGVAVVFTDIGLRLLDLGVRLGHLVGSRLLVVGVVEVGLIGQLNFDCCRELVFADPLVVAVIVVDVASEGLACQR